MLWCQGRVPRTLDYPTIKARWKMQDMNMTDRFAMHENAGRDNAGHKNAGPIVYRREYKQEALQRNRASTLSVEIV